jgi:hypothetical protein
MRKGSWQNDIGSSGCRVHNALLPKLKTFLLERPHMQKTQIQSSYQLVILITKVEF